MMNQFRSLDGIGATSGIAAILDLDGTLIREDELLPGAVDLLAHFQSRFAIASNNSSDTAETLSARLECLGLSVPPKRIVLAGEVALRMIAAHHPGARVLLLAAPPLHAFAGALGLRPDSEGGDVVLLCRDPAFSYDKLRTAVNCVTRGAPLYAANPDLTHPGVNGVRVPETGALLAAISACAGEFRATIIGKPHRHLYAEALSCLGIAAWQAVVIGDNPDTDIAGAQAMGIASLLIGAHRDAIGRDPAELLARLEA